MKRICKAIAGMLAAVFMGQAVSAAPLLGDVNGDGSVTAKDKMTLARYADGWEGYSIDEDAGDIDRDGDADAEDAQRFGRYFAGYQEEYGIGETVEPTINKIIKDVKLLYSPKAKQNYYVGESFNPDGYRFLLIYDDATTEVKELSSYESSLIVDSNKYDNNLKQFIYPMDGELEIRIIYICNNRGTRITLTIPDIVVATCPILQSIVAESSISFYMLEETPEVQQITVTAKYDNNSTRVFQVPNDATEEEKRNTHYVINKDGVSHVLQITPAIIERDTTFLRISYSERFAGSTISKYDDIEIVSIAVKNTTKKRDVEVENLTSDPL